MDGMQDLIGNEYAIRNEAPLSKSALRVKDDRWK